MMRPASTVILFATMIAAASLAGQMVAAKSGTGEGAGTANAAAGGEQAFLQNCGMCHLEGGTGTRMLALRRGKDDALLARRTDLTAEYVEYVVRHGINSMPPITRADVTEAELGQIEAYLTRDKVEAR